MTEYREALNGYVTALHEKRPYLQRSVYEVLSIISSLGTGTLCSRRLN